MKLVVDASAAGAVLFREPAAITIAPLLFDARTLLVPTLFGYEIANIARTKVRRGELNAAAAARRLGDLGTWPLERIAIEDGPLLRMAIEEGLTAYDAAYLVLARKRRARLITLDQALRAAAGPLALP